MARYTKGDEVRVDIPDVSDPDHEEYHGLQGEIVRVLYDEASEVTGDERDNIVYRIQFSEGDTADFRLQDLRPPFDPE